MPPPGPVINRQRRIDGAAGVTELDAVDAGPVPAGVSCSNWEGVGSSIC